MLSYGGRDVRVEPGTDALSESAEVVTDGMGPPGMFVSAAMG
ncbi:hypothetical protein GCM10010448_24400 [Streptomyces glomeratus]|uniref:Uncharacterized protein n=1 Tax=Streptomyces glomeratus TaxID=284452 RepID=A0ABP6LJD9_9ACTN